MDVNEAKNISNDNIPPPEFYPWWESGNYSRSMHEMITGVIMVVNIYSHTVLECILSPLFLFYFGFGICELFLACRWTNDRNWIQNVCKVYGRISHAIGSFIILSMVYGSTHDPSYRYVGILFFVYFVVVVLLCLCFLCQPKTTDNNVADSELLLDDNHAGNISQISWYDSKELGRIMYELILGTNIVLIAHYHIPFVTYVGFLAGFLLFLLSEFPHDIPPASHTLGRCFAQLIGVLSISYLVYHLFSPVFALGLGTISTIWYVSIAAFCMNKLEALENVEEGCSELVIDDEAPPIS